MIRISGFVIRYFRVPVAADEVAQTLDQSVGIDGLAEKVGGADVGDHGVLSLVVRSWNRPGGRVVGWVAQQNPWMWRHGNANDPFASYLPGP